MKPVIFCMGLPGTGKTTTSRILEQMLEGYSRIHSPDLRARLGLPPYDKLTEEQKRKYDNDYTAELEDILKKVGGIIFDKAGSTRREKEAVYDWVNDHRLDVVVICHYAPEQLAKERICAREDPGNSARPTNDPTKYERLAARWVDPEHELMYTGKKGNCYIRTENTEFYPDTGYLFPEYSHVSLIQYNTSQQVITDVIVRDRVRQFVELIEGILKNHNDPAYVASLSCHK